MKRTRLAINFLIIGGLLLFGSLFSPGVKSYMGPGGEIVTIPFQRVKAFYMFRGQWLKGEFWANISIDVYIMGRTQYQNYIENNSTTALIEYKNLSTGTYYFKPYKSGQYFLVVEKRKPIGEGIIVNIYNYEKSGLNYNFLQPGIIFTILLIGLTIVSLFQKIKEKYFH